MSKIAHFLMSADKLTIRTKVADAALLEGLQAELLRPDTVEYVTGRLAAALNELRDRRPQVCEEPERAQTLAQQRLRNLLLAIENGAETPSVFQAIRDCEAEVRRLDDQLRALSEPLDERLAGVPTWAVSI